MSLARWILLIAISIVTCAPPAQAARLCSAAFSPSTATLIQEWLRSERVREPNRFLAKLYDRKAARIAKKVDPYQLRNPLYREKIVRDLVETEIRRGSSALANFEYSMKPSQARELDRLVMRSLVEHGFHGWMKHSTEPLGFAARAKRAAKALRWNPAYRFAIEWSLPLKNVTLSEKQVEAILLDGRSALERDPELSRLVKSAKTRDRIRFVNDVLRTTVFVGFTLYIYQHYFSLAYQGAEQATKEADEKATEEFREIVAETVTVDADSALLAVALGQIQAILVEFEQKYGEKPTAQELAQIKKHVCMDQLGSVLTPSQRANCLAD